MVPLSARQDCLHSLPAGSLRRKRVHMQQGAGAAGCRAGRSEGKEGCGAGRQGQEWEARENQLQAGMRAVQWVSGQSCTLCRLYMPLSHTTPRNGHEDRTGLRESVRLATSCDEVTSASRAGCGYAVPLLCTVATRGIPHVCTPSEQHTKNQHCKHTALGAPQLHAAAA